MKLNKNEKAYKKMLKKNIKLIKEENMKSTLNSIYKLREVPGLKEVPGCLENTSKREIIGEINIYVTYLGYIDSLILYEKKDKNNVCYETDNLKSLYNNRNDLIDKIKNNTNICFDKKLSKKEIDFEVIPFSINFNVSNPNPYVIDSYFIKAYNVGYNLFEYVEKDNINQLFEKYSSIIEKYKEENKEKKQRVKMLSL